MTTSVQHFLATAAAEVGYEETGGPSGHDGNITKYWADLDRGLQGQSWCAAFVRWVCKHSGAPVLGISNPYYCPTIETYARHAGLWDTSGHYHPGDWVLFDWTGHGLAEHIGIVVGDDGSVVHTIEGNTSPTNGGSQSNGGGVYRRDRPHGSTIRGAVSFHKLLTSGSPAAPSTPVKPPAPRGKTNPNAAPHIPPYIKLGSTGEPVRYVQWAVGVPVDGSFGAQTEHGVKLFQQFHKAACGAADGVVGQHTLSALEKVTH